MLTGPHKGGAVGHRYWISLWVVVFGAIASAAQSGGGAPGRFLGTWSGTWDGAGSGGFVITIEQGQNGVLAGRVSVTGEPTYDATLKTVSFDGNKMNARYDFPPDPGGEIVLAGSFDAGRARAHGRFAKGPTALSSRWACGR
jgi:hypothetical protein